MSKKKKALKILIILLTAAIVSTFVFICVLPKIYLAHKYHTKMTDYKVVEFFPDYISYDLGGGLYWEDGGLIYEYKINGRQFEVDFFDFQFYDAYQMEDVEKWLVEDFKKNIDRNIDLVGISSGTVYGAFDKDTEKYKNIVWTRDNINELLKGECFGYIYIKKDNFEEYLINTNFQEVDDYYNNFNVNDKYKAYIENVYNKLIATYNLEEDKYKSLKTRFVLHKYVLPIISSFDSYEVDMNSLTSEQQNYLIKYD